MNQIRTNKVGVKSIVLTCVLLLGSTSLAWAESITGIWEMTMEFGGRPSYATLSVSKQADGTLAGKWGSSELSNVKFENGKLTFVRTVRIGDQEFTLDYSGTLKDGRITGTMSGDRGEFAVNGARRKPKLPVLGQWDINFNVGDRDINAKLTVSQKPDGTIEGKWDEEGEHVISKIDFKDGKLTLTRNSKIQDFEFESTYEGTVKGNDLVGMVKSQMGELEANGKRIGAALIGQWELTSTSDRGTRTLMMRVESDLTGRYEFFGGEIPMKDLKLEGDQVTFYIEFGPPDQTFKLDFKGKLDGKTLKGEMIGERGTSQITGKKIEASASVVGTWEFTRETSQGTRTSTVKIKDDLTGTYTSRDRETPVTDLKVDGNQISFKITRIFNDRQFTMEFKGQVDGDTLKGEFTTPRGSREATGKRVN